MESEQTQPVEERYQRRTAWLVRRISWTIIVLAILSYIYHPSDGWVRPLLTILSAGSALLAFSDQSDTVKRWTRLIGWAIMGISLLSAFAALLNDPGLNSLTDFLSNVSDVVKQAPLFLLVAFAHSVYVNYFLVFSIGLISFWGTPKLKKAKRDALAKDIEAARAELRRIRPQLADFIRKSTKTTLNILFQIALLPIGALILLAQATFQLLKVLWPVVKVLGIVLLVLGFFLLLILLV